MPAAITTRTKLSYGIGDLGLALTGAMMGLLFAKFLTDTVGLAPSLAAVAIFIGRSWDWINDPIQGYITDHTRSRWGRRRPYLLFGAIPMGITFMMMWWIPPLTSPIWLTVYYTVAYFLFDSMVTIVFIPYVALTPEITPDYDDRTSLTSFCMFFSLFGSLLGTVAPLLILGGASVPPEKSHTIFAIGAALAVVATIPFFITFAGTRENVEHIYQEQPKLRYILQSMPKNRPYVMAVIIYLVTVSGFEVITGTSLYFIQYKLQMPNIADYTTLTMFVVALGSIPLWLWVSKKFDKIKGYAAAILYLSVILVIYASFDHTISPFLPFVFSALAGIGISAGQTLPWAILPDTIEYGEYLTGKRHEGIYYSFMTLARKVASSFTLPTVLLLLGWAGYVPNQLQQTAKVTTTIAVMFAGIPIILFVIGGCVALRFPLNRKRFNEIQAELERRKAPLI